MFETLSCSDHADTKTGCLVRAKQLNMEDHAAPFRVTWEQDGLTRSGLVTSVHRQVGLKKKKRSFRTTSGDTVFLGVHGWKSNDFPEKTLLRARL